MILKTPECIDEIQKAPNYSKSDNVDELIRFEADILDQRAKSSVVLQLARGRVVKTPSHHEFAPE